MPITERSDGGFTLIEVLVALLVSAFLLAVISTALETARAREIRSDSQARAMLIGEEHLSRRAESIFRPGQDTRDHGKFVVTTDETPYRTDPRNFVVLSEIRVVVSDQDGQRLYKAYLRRLKILPRS